MAADEPEIVGNWRPDGRGQGTSGSGELVDPGDNEVRGNRVVRGSSGYESKVDQR